MITFSNTGRSSLVQLMIFSIYVSIFIGLAPISYADIKDSDVVLLEKKLIGVEGLKSAAKKRSSYKSIVRAGNSLINKFPDAEKRFDVLTIMFRSQKRLLSMDNNERNQKSLFKTSAKLAKAPDSYAGYRLEADLLLLNRKMDDNDASVKDRVEALRGILVRYRGTEAESKSLIVVAMIARKIESRSLEGEAVVLMSERFASDPDIVKFRLKNLGFGRVDVPVTGNFKRADGVMVSFPSDLSGQASVVVFWSKGMPDYKKELKIIQEKVSKYDDQLNIYSFNMDSLEDAGERELRDMGIHWMAMHLPQGKQSKLARIFAGEAPYGYLVNSYGYVLLVSELVKGNHVKGSKIDKIRQAGAQTEVIVTDAYMPHARSIAQLQSLLVGDFLVSVAQSSPVGSSDSIPQSSLDAIHACFTPAPLRYRLSKAEALASYSKAEEEARSVIEEFPNASNLWVAQNYRIIALMGKWKASIDSNFLVAAKEESQKVLAKKTPSGADLVASFCLTRCLLREDPTKAELVISDFVKLRGGDKASVQTYACAAILSLEFHLRSMYEAYGKKILDEHEGAQLLWPVVSFLRDRYYSFHIFRATNRRRERKLSRSNIVNLGWNKTAIPFPSSELKKLDGTSLRLPEDSNGKLTMLLFVEPPADPAESLYVKFFDNPGADRKRHLPSAHGFATKLANDHVNQELEVVVVFLTDDKERVGAIVEKYGLKCQVAMAPGGLSNPVVNKLGILSADTIPNVFLLRRNGTIAWHSTGLKYKCAFSHGFSVYQGMILQTELCDIALAYDYLEKGKYKEAAKVFAGPFPKKKDERFSWASPRFQGRALAHMKLDQWDAALGDIDMAIAEYSTKRLIEDPDFPSSSRIELFTIKAIILEKLGRSDEATRFRKLAAVKPAAYSPNIYTQFHEKLKSWRLKSMGE